MDLKHARKARFRDSPRLGWMAWQATLRKGGLLALESAILLVLALALSVLLVLYGPQLFGFWAYVVIAAFLARRGSNLLPPLGMTQAAVGFQPVPSEGSG